MLRAIRNSLCLFSLMFSLSFTQTVYSTNEDYLLAFSLIEFDNLNVLKFYSNSELLKAKDQEGNNLLLYAVKMKKIEITKYFLSLEIFDLHAKNYRGESILSCLQKMQVKNLNDLFLTRLNAVEFRIASREIEVQMDLKKPISMIFDRFGNSVVHYAIVNKNIKLLEVVVENPKINLEQKNVDGVSPQYLAKKTGNVRAEFILQKAIEKRRNSKFRNIERKNKLTPLSEELLEVSVEETPAT